MRKAFIIVLGCLFLCISILFFINVKNDNKNIETGTRNYNIKIGGKPDKITIYSDKISKAPSANLDNSKGNLEDETFISSIKQHIKDGKILNSDCKKFYILVSSIHELCYDVDYLYEIGESEDTEASGVRYIVASNRNFSDAEVVIYTGDNSKARKEYQLSGDILRYIIDNKEEYGIMLAENRVVLVDKNNSIVEQYVGDKLFDSADGDCFNALKEKGYYINSSDILVDDKVIEFDVE